MGNPLEAIGLNINTANKYIQGIGTGDSSISFKNIKKIFDENGKMATGNVPTNTGSIYGWGYAQPSKASASTNI